MKKCRWLLEIEKGKGVGSPREPPEMSDNKPCVQSLSLY